MVGVEDEWSKASCLPRRPAEDDCELIAQCTRTEATHWLGPAAAARALSSSSTSGDDSALWYGELLDGEGDELSGGSLAAAVG